MNPNTQDSSIQDDEIDLREVFAALSRRWRWVLGGGLLGLALAGGAHSLKPHQAAQVQANLIVDVAQGPCYSRSRQLNTFEDPSVLGMGCTGEFETMRLRLDQLAQQRGLLDPNDDQLDSYVEQFAFDAKGKQKSPT